MFRKLWYPVSRAFGKEDVDDLTSLKHLHEPALLQVLQNRFNRDQLYTMCGPILLAVNPFKGIQGLYEKTVVDRFLLDSENLIHTPHVFSTALRAYKSSVRQGVSQSILISGESGAGKTETTKLVMQFLSACGRASKSDINRQVLESNPLLEAFGNACTLRNDNSSRFGKFIQLQFDGEKDHLRLKGARIETYLLEKIRVTNQIQGERNFHIFYQICAAAAV
ncbi:myosin C, putative, partial [Perkinsus marinus ATCC 50983]